MFASSFTDSLPQDGAHRASREAHEERTPDACAERPARLHEQAAAHDSRNSSSQATPFDFRKATAIGDRINQNDDQLKKGKGPTTTGC